MTKYEALVLVFVLLLLGALLAPAVQNPRGGGHGPRCKNNLKQIGLALHNYHDVYGSFPPAYVADANGKPMHSWRVLLLPYIDEEPLYKKYRFDEPWDGPNNSKLHSHVPKVYRCPQSGSNNLAYLAVTGKYAAWPGATARAIRDFKDGLDKTAVVVEQTDCKIHWMEPRDLEFDKMSFKIDPKSPRAMSGHQEKIGGLLFSEVHHATPVLMGDGAVRVIPEETSEVMIKAMLTIDGAEKVDLP